MYDVLDYAGNYLAAGVTLLVASEIQDAHMARTGEFVAIVAR